MTQEAAPEAATGLSDLLASISDIEALVASGLSGNVLEAVTQIIALAKSLMPLISDLEGYLPELEASAKAVAADVEAGADAIGSGVESAAEAVYAKVSSAVASIAAVL
jgi:hypothetical protein